MKYIKKQMKINICKNIHYNSEIKCVFFSLLILNIFIQCVKKLRDPFLNEVIGKSLNMERPSLFNIY